MIQCNYCSKRFHADANGLAAKTFHEILHEPEVTEN